MRIIIIKMILDSERAVPSFEVLAEATERKIVMSCDAKSQKRFRRFQQKLRRRLHPLSARGTAVSAEGRDKQPVAKAGGEP